MIMEFTGEKVILFKFRYRDKLLAFGSCVCSLKLSIYKVNQIVKYTDKAAAITEYNRSK